MNGTMLDELKEMNKSFGTGLDDPLNNDDPGTKDEPIKDDNDKDLKDEPAEDPKDEPIDEPKNGEPEEPEEPNEPEEPKEPEEPEEPEPEPEPDDRDKIIHELKSKLDDLEKRLSPKTDTTEPEPKSEPESPLQLDKQDFISGLDLNELAENPEKFNEVLNNVYQKAISDARKVLGEETLRAIPDIVKSNIVTMTNLQKASEEFYNENEDLRPFKKVVASVFEELSSENPDKHYGEILKDVGPEVRRRLDLHKKATQPKKDTIPRLPRKKGSPKKTSSKPSLTGLELELAEMNKVLRS